MAIATFDTLEYSKTLQDAGMERNQADAFARAQAKAMADMQSSFEKQNEASRKELATKGDIQKVNDKIAETKHELLKWMVTGFLAQSALLVAIIAFLK